MKRYYYVYQSEDGNQYRGGPFDTEEQREQALEREGFALGPDGTPIADVDQVVILFTVDDLGIITLE